MARVLLLGSTGFLGRAVTHKLLDAGHQVRVLVRDPMRAAAYKVRGAQVVVGDVMNAASVAAAMNGVEHVVDLVAVRRNKPQSMFEVNSDGPRIVGQAAKAAGVQSVVLVSAIGAKLDPKLKYLTSRWMGEQELAKSGVGGAVLRFSLVLGDEGGVLAEFERLSAFGPFIVIPGDGKVQYQPIIRDDAARCIVEAIGKTDVLGKIIELGGPEVVTFETIYDWFLTARRIKKGKLHLPPELLMPGAAVMELLSSDPLVTPDEIRSAQLPNIADGLDSVTTRFGWRPVQPSSWAPSAWAPKRR